MAAAKNSSTVAVGKTLYAGTFTILRLIIRMYLEAGEPHHLPHFHAYYGNAVAVYQLSPIELMAGALARRQARLVEAWAELHEAELLSNWQRLQSGQQPLPIAPLE